MRFGWEPQYNDDDAGGGYGDMGVVAATFVADPGGEDSSRQTQTPQLTFVGKVGGKTHLAASGTGIM